MKRLLSIILIPFSLHIHSHPSDLIETSCSILQECMHEDVYIPRRFNKKLNLLLANATVDELIEFIIQAEKLDNSYLINGAAAIIIDRLDNDPINKESLLTYLEQILQKTTYAFITKYNKLKQSIMVTRACGDIELSVADYLSQNDLPLEHLGQVGILRFDSKNLTSLYGIQNISLSDVGYIVFNGNCITGNIVDPQFPANPFQGLPNTYHLLMDDNMIESLPANFLNLTPTMRELSISQNLLSALSSSFTTTVDTLAYLNLSTNALASIPSTIFNNNPFLETLYLDHNLLTSIPSNLFQQNPKITFLYLNNNLLTLWPTNLLNNLTQLRYLDLSFNSLTAFAPTSLPNGCQVILTGNLLTALQQALIQATYPNVSFIF